MKSRQLIGAAAFCRAQRVRTSTGGFARCASGATEREAANELTKARTARLALRIALLVGALVNAPFALAVPSYARQTDLPCSACHVRFPELNSFGRQFKLN